MSKPKVVPMARAMLRPVMEAAGYPKADRAGPGLEWSKRVDPFGLSFGLASGPWNELTGGRLTVRFDVVELPLWGISFAEHLAPSGQQEWRAVASAVFDRALGVGGAGGELDAELIDIRRSMLEIELDGLAAGYLDAFGWPWFVEQDLVACSTSLPATSRTSSRRSWREPRRASTRATGGEGTSSTCRRPWSSPPGRTSPSSCGCTGRKSSRCGCSTRTTPRGNASCRWR